MQYILLKCQMSCEEVWKKSRDDKECEEGLVICCYRVGQQHANQLK